MHKRPHCNNSIIHPWASGEGQRNIRSSSIWYGWSPFISPSAFITHFYNFKMKVKQLFHFFCFAALSALFTFCKDAPSVTEGAYSNGIFIVNEGPFQSGSGTIDFWDRTTNSLTSNLFELENSGAVLGNIVQSINTHAGKTYIVVNNAAKIEVVSAATFKSVGTITGLAQPRYFLPVSDTKAFVSQWGSDGFTGSVAVVDLLQNLVVKTIPLGFGAETMTVRNGKLYVALSGGFGNDNRVAVLNIASEMVEKYITVGDNPKSLAFDNSGVLWVLCGGKFDFVSPANNTPGGIYKIENDTVVGTGFPLSTGADNLVLDKDKTTAYFTTQTMTFKTPLALINPSIFANRSFYALGYDAQASQLYGADAKDFSSRGAIIVFDANGGVIRTFDAGVIPTDFGF